MTERTVIYLSSCAVDGKGVPDPFMLQELPWLGAHFDRVLLVSYYGVAELTGLEAQKSFRIASGGSRWVKWRARLRALVTRELWQELALIRRKGMLSLRNGVKLLLFTIRGNKLHLWLEGLLKNVNTEQATLYAYWMSYEAYAAALSKRMHPELRFVARGHAFDIDEGRNGMNPYLMKRFIAAQADGLYLISEYAKQQYLAYMQGAVDAEKLHVACIGSKGEPIKDCKEPPFFAEGHWRVVSCATISEIKQLPVLVDALSQWEGAPLHWLHIGGGAQEEAVRAYADQRLANAKNISYQITGRMSNEKVQEIYATQAFDMFVSTSRMEGVPVSMMEAMRFGIPVIAPRVGGIPELVDEQVGILYEAESGATGVMNAMRAFASLPKAQVLEMRKNAQARWNDSFRSEALMPLIFPKEAGQRKDAERVEEGSA